MPIYEYQCQACGRRSEALQGMNDSPLVTCAECGGALRKLVSSPAFQFKGTGWYATDYGGKDGSKGSGKEDGKDSGKDTGKDTGKDAGGDAGKDSGKAASDSGKESGTGGGGGQKSPESSPAAGSTPAKKQPSKTAEP